eukprot:TRINITY_DN14160_c0_g2_i1.p2 TRINITY_DN14160_c0_g2~~TRINITY_DN14160_c0_g2_i1.p2  ORF type:complete len:201 (+),score=100.50 TRINITY_DN14160_c0_g2_i1:173-775(+)
MEASVSPEQKDITKEQPSSPVRRVEEQKVAKEEPQEIPEPETEEELERKERFQELQTFLKKYNKRVPECILVKDFAKILRLRGEDPTEQEIEDYTKQHAKYDKDSDGVIENKALFEILEERKKSPDTPEEFKKALLTLVDENGKLLKEEMRFHLRTMGEPLEEKEVKKLLEMASDPADARYISIDGFVELIFKAKVVKNK